MSDKWTCPHCGAEVKPSGKYLMRRLNTECDRQHS